MDTVRTLVGISVFWLGLSVLGDGFAALVVPVRVAAFADPTRAATAVGLVTFVALLAAMLVQPVAGAASDALRARAGTRARRAILAVGVAIILVGLVAFGAAGSLAAILAAFVLLQIGVGVAQAPQQALIPDLVEPSRRGRAAGLKGLADVGGAFVAFLVLGALLSTGDPAWAVSFAAVAVVVTAGLAILLVRERPPDAGAGPTRRGRSPDVFGVDLRSHPAFVRAVLARFFFLLGTFAIGRFLLLFVAERLAIEPAGAAQTAGWLLAALTLLTAIASLPCGWLADRAGRTPVMVAGALLGCVGALLLTTASSELAMLGFGSLLAVGSAAFTTANWAMTADLVPSPEAARFMAIANYGTAGAAAMAGLFGPLADIARSLAPAAGYTPVLVGAAACFAVSVVVAARLVGGVSEARSASPEGSPS